MKFQKLPRHNFNISISPPLGGSGFNCTTLLEMKSYLADKDHDERDFDMSKSLSSWSLSARYDFISKSVVQLKPLPPNGGEMEILKLCRGNFWNFMKFDFN